MNPAGSAAGIVLAAGASARFASFKPAALIGGRPMLHHCLEGLRGVCGQLIVVGGYNIGALRALLQSDDFGPVELVENAGWAGGMFTSVKAGIGRVRAGAAFVLPVDCPMVPAAVYETLLRAPGRAVVPVFREMRGHPVLIRRRMFSTILSESDTSSLREVLSRAGVREVRINSPAVLFDLDTPEELARAEASAE